MMGQINARPILFSGPMVRALLAGTKTQTRRVVKGVPLEWLDDAGFTPEFVADRDNGLCPYGAPGDLLYVREAWSADWSWRDEKPVDIIPAAPIWYWADGNPTAGDWTRPKPSIHQPRWASRLTLEITNVRIQRLLDCAEADAIAEGLQVKDQAWLPQYRGADDLPWRSEFPRDAYFDLWDHINGKGAAEADPWIWAVSFKVHEQNVDAFLEARAA